MMNSKLITFQDLSAQKGIAYSRDHLRRMVNCGAFPKPIRLSSARIAWREADIDSWIDQKAGG
jgi:prophage regulatory protein